MTPLRLLLRGFGLSAGLIVAIGAQNAFVLRQGLRRQHVWLTALICIACDILMFSIGGVGFGSLVAAVPALTTLTAWGGALFLLVYGALAFRSALRPSALEVQRNGEATLSRRAVILTALGVSLLNPHAWLDTVVLVGGSPGSMPEGSASSSCWGPCWPRRCGFIPWPLARASWPRSSRVRRPGACWTH